MSEPTTNGNAWMGATDWTPPHVDTQIPSPARVYDAWLGGKDNFAVDREVANRVAEQAPWVVQGVKANREFLVRAVRHLTALGVTQFLDIGSGLPTSPNVHELAGDDARVVYVDNDPIVLTHARALHQSSSGGILVVDGDLLDPHTVLDNPGVRGFLDWGKPIALLLVAIMHFVPDEAGPAAIVAAYRDALPSGSYMAISHTTDSVGEGERTRAAAGVYARSGTAPFVVRDEAAIRSLFGGLDLIYPPGLVPANYWSPAPVAVNGPPATILAGVGRLTREA